MKWAGKSYWRCSWITEIRVRLCQPDLATSHALLSSSQLDVHEPIRLRAYMRKRNMDVAPQMELPPHVQRRHKRRSTASHLDEKLEETELMLLNAGVRPAWLQIHRVINKR